MNGIRSTSDNKTAVLQETEDIRPISDVFAADGNAVSSFGLSNMVWGFGQFVGAPSDFPDCVPNHVVRFKSTC